jgi:hypothetical protein
MAVNIRSFCLTLALLLAASHAAAARPVRGGRAKLKGKPKFEHIAWQK